MRLNFSGAIAGLGHGLSTLGQQWIEEQQRVAADARLQARERAMAGINHDYRTLEANDQSKREINQYEASTPSVVARESAVAPIRTQERLAEVDAQTAAGDHREAVQHGYRMIEQNAGEARHVVHNYTNDQGHPVIVYGDGRERVLFGTVRAPEGEDPGAVVHRYVNSDNHPVLVLRDGTEHPGTVRQSNNGDPLGLGEGQPAENPAPASAPAARPTLRAPARPQPRVTAAPGSFVRDPQGRRHRINPDGSIGPAIGT